MHIVSWHLAPLHPSCKLTQHSLSEDLAQMSESGVPEYVRVHPLLDLSFLCSLIVSPPADPLKVPLQVVLCQSVEGLAEVPGHLCEGRSILQEAPF